jgi:CO/xanthine dehydrogenase Mo-binding subunit
VGQPVPRREDERLVRGKGKFVDDVIFPNQAYAAVLRSIHAHALIKRIDRVRARALPGVIGILTADDLGDEFCAESESGVDDPASRTLDAAGATFRVQRGGTEVSPPAMTTYGCHHRRGYAIG